MTPADKLFMAGYAAALDAAERAGARILASSLPTLRREHAATGLLAFVDEARAALAIEGITITGIPSPEGPPMMVVSSTPQGQAVVPSPSLDRSDARAQGFTGDACRECAGFRVKRNGTCTVCADCGATTGCS